MPVTWLITAQITTLNQYRFYHDKDVSKLPCVCLSISNKEKGKLGSSKLGKHYDELIFCITYVMNK